MLPCRRRFSEERRRGIVPVLASYNPPVRPRRAHAFVVVAQQGSSTGPVPLLPVIDWFALMAAGRPLLILFLLPKLVCVFWSR